MIGWNDKKKRGYISYSVFLKGASFLTTFNDFLFKKKGNPVEPYAQKRKMKNIKKKKEKKKIEAAYSFTDGVFSVGLPPQRSVKFPASHTRSFEKRQKHRRTTSGYVLKEFLKETELGATGLLARAVKIDKTLTCIFDCLYCLNA